MVTVTFDEHFCKVISKMDNSYKNHVKKQIKKIINNPLTGKPMQHNRKGTREVYVSPFRLSYIYNESKNNLIFVDIYHKINNKL